MFGAVTRYLANAAGKAGVLLALDDLQWAGHDAIDLLGHLAHAAPEIRLRVIGAYRETDVEPQHPLSPLLADLGRNGVIGRLPLGPLTTEEADELLLRLVSDQERLPRSVRESVLRTADGIPFFLVSYAHGLQAGAFSGDMHVAPSWTLVESVRQRIRVLPEHVREVLEAAAVAGRRVVPSLLATALAQSHEQILLSLDPAERAGILTAQEAGIYRFAHDVIREVIENGLTQARRTLLHRHIARAIEQSPGEVHKTRAAELALHLLSGDEPDRALPYLITAGDQAASVLAHGDAERHYRTASETARLVGDRALEAEALDKLGCSLRFLGRYRGALEALESAASLYRSMADPENEAQAVAEIGRVHGLRLTPHEGLARIQELLSRHSEHQSSHALVELRIVQGSLLPTIENFAAGLAAARQAVELSGELDDGRLQARALYCWSSTLVGVGHLEEAVQRLEQVVRLAETTGDLETLYQALCTVADVHQRRGEVDRGKCFIRRALELSGQMADPRRMGSAAWKLYWLNEWGEARAHLERAVVLSRELGEPEDSSAHQLIYLAELCWAQGDREAAAGVLQEGLARAERSGDAGMTQFAQMIFAHLDVDAGHPEVAVARLEPYRTAFQRTSGIGALAQLAEAYLLMGEDARAAEIVDNEPVSVLNPGLGLGMAAVFALRVKGMLRTRQGRWEEARRAFDEAVDLGKKRSYHWFLAWALYDYGLMSVQMGEPEGGRARLEEALALFQTLGAREHARRTQRTLAELASTAPRRRANE